MNGESSIGNGKSNIGIQNGQLIWDKILIKNTLLLPAGDSIFYWFWCVLLGVQESVAFDYIFIMDNLWVFYGSLSSG